MLRDIIGPAKPITQLVEFFSYKLNKIDNNAYIDISHCKINITIKNRINDQLGISTTVLPHYYDGIIDCVRRDQNSIYYGEVVVPTIDSFIQINSILD